MELPTHQLDESTLLAVAGELRIPVATVIPALAVGYREGLTPADFIGFAAADQELR